MMLMTLIITYTPSSTVEHEPNDSKCHLLWKVLSSYFVNWKLTKWIVYFFTLISIAGVTFKRHCIWRRSAVNTLPQIFMFIEVNVVHFRAIQSSNVPFFFFSTRSTKQSNQWGVSRQTPDWRKGVLLMGCKSLHAPLHATSSIDVITSSQVVPLMSHSFHRVRWLSQKLQFEVHHGVRS